MSEPVELVLSEREEGIRLDKVLAERLPDLTRTAIQRLLEEEQVLINGKPAAKIVREGLEIRLQLGFRIRNRSAFKRKMFLWISCMRTMICWL